MRRLDLRYYQASWPLGLDKIYFFWSHINKKIQLADQTKGTGILSIKVFFSENVVTVFNVYVKQFDILNNFPTQSMINYTFLSEQNVDLRCFFCEKALHPIEK